jgi:hypothetical protein
MEKILSIEINYSQILLKIIHLGIFDKITIVLSTLKRFSNLTGDAVNGRHLVYRLLTCTTPFTRLNVKWDLVFTCGIAGSNPA